MIKLQTPKMYLKLILINLIVQFLIFLPTLTQAETIVLKSEKQIIVEKSWEEDNHIWFIFQGMKACIPKHEVKKIVHNDPKQGQKASLPKVKKNNFVSNVSRPTKTSTRTQTEQPDQVTPSPQDTASQPNITTCFRKDGFRDLRWGVNVSTVSGLQKRAVETGLDDVIEYDRPSDPLKIGNVELFSIIYAFWKDELYTVTIWTQGQSNYMQLRDRVFAQYGQGYRCQQYPERYLWSEGLTDMMLRYDETHQQGALWLRSRELDRKYKLSKMNGHTTYLKWMNSN
ncbi:MAG: hypothetical protein PVI77_07390 [Desulfobacterales bacterium]